MFEHARNADKLDIKLRIIRLELETAIKDKTLTLTSILLAPSPEQNLALELLTGHTELAVSGTSPKTYQLSFGPPGRLLPPWQAFIKPVNGPVTVKVGLNPQAANMTTRQLDKAMAMDPDFNTDLKRTIPAEGCYLPVEEASVALRSHGYGLAPRPLLRNGQQRWVLYEPGSHFAAQIEKPRKKGGK